MADDRNLPFFRSPLLADNEQTRDNDSDGHDAQTKEAQREDEEQALDDNPRFQRRTEATNAELFYDLFFVANLTVFTNVHEVNSGKALKQYVGFFCILWFTWYQVGLYDVRFSTQSVFEYIARAIQLLIMMVFATAGPKFNVGAKSQLEENSEPGEAPSLPYFQILTLALTISRLVLVFQYVQALYLTRQYKKVRIPMALIAATYLVAAMVYLGLYWTFNNLNSQNGNRSYITWYVIAICETILATAISMKWRAISFKGTHLVQRMSLLTLIIIGEGVIGVAEKCQMVVQGSDALEWSASTVADIVCATLILYLFYLVYFGWLEEEHFGSIRQQIWSFLHFPLHVALVLAVEGVAQCIMWRAAVHSSDNFANLSTPWSNLNSTSPASAFESAAQEMNASARVFFDVAIETSSGLRQTLQGLQDLNNLNNASALVANGAENYKVAEDALYWAELSVLRTIFNVAGFEPKENASEAIPDPNAVVDFADEHAEDRVVSAFSRTADVFSLTYAYFYICTGCVVILCCVIGALSRKKKLHHHWIRLGISMLIGLGLGLLAVIEATSSYYNFANSPWLLPTVTISLFVIVVCNNVRLTSSRG